MKISEYEMQRKIAVSQADASITNAMRGHELTPTEWMLVFSNAMQRMIGYALREERGENEDEN